MNRAEGRIQLQSTDRTGFFFVELQRGSRLIANPTTYLDLHVELAVLGQIADHQFGIDDFHVMIELNVTRRNRSGLVLGQGQHGFLARMHSYRDFLQVQQDFDDVFPPCNPSNGGVFVQHTVDLHFGNGTSGDG